MIFKIPSFGNPTFSNTQKRAFNQKLFFKFLAITLLDTKKVQTTNTVHSQTSVIPKFLYTFLTTNYYNINMGIFPLLVKDQNYSFYMNIKINS